MRLKTLLVMNAVVNAIFGIGLVLVPGSVIGLFVLQMPMYNPLGTQLLGTNLIGFAVLNYLARNAGEGDALLQPILLANLVANAMGFVLALIVQLGSTATVTNWLSVALTLFFALGYAYFLVMSRRPSASLVSSQR
jgi:hypothetical protein